LKLITLLLLIFSTIVLAEEETRTEVSGYIELEQQYFFKKPLYEDQKRNAYSIAIQPEYYHSWNDDQEFFLAVPFFRYDLYDSDRTHMDLREFYYQLTANNYELRLGARKVFWGVTESAHLVDIINQTDLVENIDGEEKLGQPMLNLAWINDWGTIDFFIMPYFRERSYPGDNGRLRTNPAIDTDDADYESSAEEWHTDFAVRYSNTFDEFDVGLSYFYGTSRDPFIQTVYENGIVELVPYYEIINQVGLDLQYTYEEWLWKLENIIQSGGQETFTAMVGGFEYTFFNISDNGIDLGLLLEYLWDSRGPNKQALYENDIFTGLRLTFNDIQSTDLLFGVIYDLDGKGQSISLEASRRIAENWRVAIEIRSFSGIKNDELIYAIRQDDYALLSLSYWF
jgi:hypothetical protein